MWPPDSTLRTRFVALGGCETTKDEGQAFSTALGSCIALCARHPDARVGGINHFSLPDGSAAGGRVRGADAQRYGAHAIETLINQVCSLAGDPRRRALEFRAYGGGRAVAGLSDVGAANVEFLLSVLKRDGLSLAASDLGGPVSRRIVFHPASGRTWVRALPQSRVCPAKKRAYLAERTMAREVEKARAAGEVELF